MSDVAVTMNAGIARIVATVAAWTVAGYWSNPRSPDDPYQEAPDGKFADGAVDPAG